ncbi:uncharacterized protein L969DRAFT_52837 [Mixia osmundae IAM 14324]|uniref:uncharacterized protein n=1 Tax=Mixia osmundae (strain CBS 9802 / IAM 14324 / JCM 22182 / KY 12970) TaxID=764103 RepID=UPI0004A54F72|nr:uncharacterized protein L969DRAFT_52837 [Mixia osmundae IAM 14324]KEI37805.1 hypothetical protein L969DRAFT_52837 [Mixia osmundae IAM 14324]
MAIGLQGSGSTAKVYVVNGNQSSVSLPDWLANSKERKRRKISTQDAAASISLIQDFDFPQASNKIKTSPDGRFILATGTYKPRMKVFELSELTCKFERTTDAENVDFCVLSSDWTKTLHLQADRSIELHNQAAAYYRTRIPRQGRCLAYHFPSCDALIGGAGNEVYRFNLEQGRMLAPYVLPGSRTDSLITGVNALDINPAHQLLAFGTDTAEGRGAVEFVDPRARERIRSLALPYASLASTSSVGTAAAVLPLLGDDEVSQAERPTPGGLTVTALASASDGLNLAVGTSTGHTLLYDLRSASPYLVKDQGYGLPIKKLLWLETRQTGDHAHVGSADAKIVKIWDSKTSKNLVSINPPASINDMHVYPDSGLIMLANEASPMTACYVPALGPAPRWARFLDNMTEEMETDQVQTIYDDYKFVDRQELAALGLDHLIGTSSLKAYMHGFFVDLRLYTKARAIANPFQYAEHREKLVRQKLEKEQESRIRASTRRPAAIAPSKVKVNRELAQKLLEREQKAAEQKGRRSKQIDGAGTVVTEPALLSDDRFKSLFADDDFAIDPESREYAMLNPSSAAQAKKAADSEDSSKDDDLLGGFYNPRAGRGQETNSRPRDRQSVPAIDARMPRMAPRMVNTSRRAEASANKTFGERLQKTGKSRDGRSIARGTSDEVLGVQRHSADAGGGVEFSFIPGEGDSLEKEKRKKKVPAKANGFGSGLEKRKNADVQDESLELGQAEASGRTARRKPMRSASKNVVRQL